MSPNLQYHADEIAFAITRLNICLNAEQMANILPGALLDLNTAFAQLIAAINIESPEVIQAMVSGSRQVRQPISDLIYRGATSP